MNDCTKSESAEVKSPSRYRRVVARLPLTMRPALNQQIAEWDTLFPFERKRLTGFIDGIESLSPAELHRLMQPLREIEDRMGIAASDLSETANTLESASLLARSELYPEWRGVVEQIFETIDAAHRNLPPEATRNRLLLLILPAELPFGASPLWDDWQGRGRELAVANSRALVEHAVRGSAAHRNLASLSAARGCSDPADLWMIDAGAQLAGLYPPSAPALVLSYTALKPFRDRLLAGLNSIPKDLTGSDQVIAELRRQDWESAWANQLAGQPRLRRFVMDVFLSGNGALIFPTAFVEWAASEALRRARPQCLVARFGLRPKPKPFTGIAIFENQQTISKLPDLDDPENSAIDALVLARYIWLTAARYPESERTFCVCVAESRNQAYVIAPPGIEPPFTREATAEDLYAWIAAQMAA